jgi:hypothetical protein
MIGVGRLYTVSFDNVSYTNANGDHDYFEITPADDKVCVVEAIYVYTTTEVGDAQEEQVRWSIVRGHTTSGSGGSAPTPAPLLSTDTAAGFTTETSNTSIASTAGTTLHVGTYNIRTGLEFVPPPEHRIIVTQAHTTLVVRQLSTLADDASMSGTLYVRELG